MTCSPAPFVHRLPGSILHPFLSLLAPVLAPASMSQMISTPPEDRTDEEDLPTIADSQKTKAGVSCTNGHTRRACCHQTQTPKGKKTTHGLNGRSNFAGSASPDRPHSERRPARLQTGAQFGRVRREGRTTAGRYLLVRTIAPAPDGRLRTGLSVSRKFHRSAVRRNRAKRLLREALKQVHLRLRPAWVLLIPRRAILNSKAQQVTADLEEVLSRTGLLDESGRTGGCGREFRDAR